MRSSEVYLYAHFCPCREKSELVLLANSRTCVYLSFSTGLSLVSPAAAFALSYLRTWPWNIRKRSREVNCLNGITFSGLNIIILKLNAKN